VLVIDRVREAADEDGGASTVASIEKSRCDLRDESPAIVVFAACFVSFRWDDKASLLRFSELVSCATVSWTNGGDGALDSTLTPLRAEETLPVCSIVASTLICGRLVVSISGLVSASGTGFADELLDASTRTSIGSKAFTSRTNDFWHLEQAGLNLPTLLGFMLIAFLQ
jgi:hypothetical protein